MELDLAQAFGWVTDTLAGDRPVGQSMRRLVGVCADAYPHRDWNRLRELPFGDTAPLREWIVRVLEADPPPFPLRGLWFGIFNPSCGGVTSADFYVSGTDRFDADTHSMEWAVRPAWWPDGRCAGSDVMAMIYRVAYEKDGLGNYAEYPLCLAYTALAVRELLAGAGVRDCVNCAERPGIAVGFDSGDFILLGRLGQSGIDAMR
jgi:hypothetical protein